MKCPACGENNFAWAKSCDHCRAPFGGSEATRTTAPDQRVLPLASSPHLLLAVGDEIKTGFEVVEIFEGGMGIVYICKRSASAKLWHVDGAPHSEITGDSSPWRHVVKTFRPEVIAAGGGLQRFQRECLVWATLLPHPNVVRAHSVDSGGAAAVLVAGIR